MRFAPGALVRPARAAGEPGREHQPKIYFIFSFDMVPQAQLDEDAEVARAGGDRADRRPI